jgi:hypothetical protein
VIKTRSSVQVGIAHTAKRFLDWFVSSLDAGVLTVYIVIQVYIYMGAPVNQCHKNDPLIYYWVIVGMIYEFP